MNRLAILGVAVAILVLVPRAAPAAETPAPAPAPAAAPAKPAAETPAKPAAETPSNDRSWLLGGTTLGIGKNSFAAELGWPGISLTFLHGAAERLDVGINFAFNYGLEGVTVVTPGLKLDIVARLHLFTQDKFSFGVRASPGLVMYFPTTYQYLTYFEPPNFHGSYVTFGLALPVEFLGSILINHEVSVNMAIGLPMALIFVPDLSFIFPIQPGAGVEYKLDNSFSLTLDTRFGPSLFMTHGGTQAYFSFKVLMGIGYRF